MDKQRIDGLARLVARASTSRRGLAAVAAGLVGLALPKLVASRQTCQPENAWCTLWLGCCDGTVCTMQLTNPNLGVCLPGEDFNGAGFVFAGVTPSSSSDSPSAETRERAQRTATATATSTATPTRTSGGNGNGNGGGKNKKQRKDDKKETKQDRRANRRDDDTTPTPTATPTATPTPSSASEQVRLTMAVNCDAETETVRIRNVGEIPFTLIKIRADIAESLEPAGLRSRTLRPGDSISAPRDFPGMGTLWSTDLGETDEVTLYVGTGDRGDTVRCFRGYCDGRAARAVRCPGR